MENNTTAELFWCRVKEWFLKMADNVVYADESKETVDIINLLLLGWILLGLMIYILGNIIATQLQKRKSKTVPAPGSETSSPTCPEKVSPKPDESVSAPLVSEPQEDIKEELAEKIPKLTAVPECIGGEADTVRWVNDVFSWIYTQGIVSPILDAWMSALNARTRMSSTEHGILIDFKDITPESQPPLLTNIIACDDDRRDQVVQCEVDAQTLGFEIAVTQFKEKEKNTFPGTLNVHTLSGKLTIECLPDNMFIIKFMEHPQLKLKIGDDALKMFPPEDQSAMQDVIYDIATDAIMSAIVQVRFSSYSECPRRNSYKTLSESGTLEFLSEKSENKLLVKVIRAEDLGGSKGCSKPYCVVEMDDPPQRFETLDVEHENSPVWDESFVFAVNGQNAELLFEIYDKGSKEDENFLGLCIVSIEELLKSAGQQQTIPLEARPLENDAVTGSLTLEFNVLYNDKQIGDGHVTRNGEIVKPGKVVETNSRITAGGTVITTTTIKRTTEDAADLKDAALKELEKQGKSGAPSKSTLIIHSVQREVIQPTVKVKMDESGNWQEVYEPESSGPDSLEASPASHKSKESQSQSSRHESESSSPSRGKTDDRSRPKEKTFIGKLRRRLSFRKQRSKSAEQKHVESASMYSHDSTRSVSSDRARPFAASRETSSLRSAMRFLAVPGGSTRSSLSEASGLSTSSTRTYIHENSTLVVETNENGIIRRYLIPPALINRTKWKKRGIKLHIYNDHTFVAKHFSGSTTCQVCKKFLSRRPGKQGYQCRDCNVMCHKSCHVKVAEFCPSSSVSNMEVEYIQDPKATKPTSS